MLLSAEAGVPPARSAGLRCHQQLTGWQAGGSAAGTAGRQLSDPPAFNSCRTATLQPPSLCRRVQQFIRQAYKEDWLCWSHEPEYGEEGEADGEEEGRLAAWLGGGGFTLRRK